MRAIVKVFVVWTLGLAVLFGLVDRSLARQKRQDRWRCACDCTYQGKVDHTVSFYGSDSTDCEVAVGKVCQVQVGNLIRQGSITGCLGTNMGSSAISPGGPGALPPIYQPPASTPGEPRPLGGDVKPAQ